MGRLMVGLYKSQQREVSSISIGAGFLFLSRSVARHITVRPTSGVPSEAMNDYNFCSNKIRKMKSILKLGLFVYFRYR